VVPASARQPAATGSSFKSKDRRETNLAIFIMTFRFDFDGQGSLI
jgi:hypothetical protein